MPESLEVRFEATPEKGEVSALLLRPDGATHMLVLSHGASSNMRSPMMASIAEALDAAGIATLRYNFPYSENGRGRDSNDVCVATVRAAAATAQASARDLILLAGGHSFGGRMTSMAQSESPIDGIRGLVFFSFPLHPAGAPSITRAEHLGEIDIPMLFLSGTRDALAGLGLLEPAIRQLGKLANLHLLDTADHSFKVLKRTRVCELNVFVEMARIARHWADGLK